MSETKHSDAPFTCEGSSIFDAGGKYIGAGAMSGLWRHGEQEANLALWTAAPDLYETERKLTNEVSGVLDQYEEGLRQLIGNTNYAVLKTRCDEARAALAKVSPHAPSDQTETQGRK